MVVLVILIGGYLIYQNNNQIEPIKEDFVPTETYSIELPTNVISEKDCTAKGGEVFNTLGETSYDGELIGKIEGLNCPCACLVEGKENTIINKEDSKKATPKVLKQQTLIILDASGSMWGKVEGKAKIDIAKEVVKKTVANFKDMELGLMAYGHRRKGDCKDIEILTTPTKNNGESISRMVDKISPKGMTPMGNSVLMAAESLKYTEQKATIILVSDGIETCDVDLCELGKKLEEAGVDFTAHVIGFDMTEEQTAGLKCLAAETGGTFTSAKNAKDLDEALKKTVEASSCSKEKLGEAIITAPANVNAGAKMRITWTGPNQRHDQIGIFPKNSKEWNSHLNTFTYLDDKNGSGELLVTTKVGDYDVVYFADCGTILGRTSFKVGEVEATLIIPGSVSVGSEIEVVWTGPSQHNDDIGIFPKGSSRWNDHLKTFSYLDGKNGKSIITAPTEVGEYDMVYWLNGEKILTRESFTVAETTAKMTNIPATVQKGAKFPVSWEGPNNKGNAITILPLGSSNWNDHVGGNLYSINTATGTKNMTAPDEIGQYDVVFWLKQKKILDRKSLNVIN